MEYATPLKNMELEEKRRGLDWTFWIVGMEKNSEN